MNLVTAHKPAYQFNFANAGFDDVREPITGVSIKAGDSAVIGIDTGFEVAQLNAFVNLMNTVADARLTLELIQ